jgi:hypothetical protein
MNTAAKCIQMSLENSLRLVLHDIDRFIRRGIWMRCVVVVVREFGNVQGWRAGLSIGGGVDSVQCASKPTTVYAYSCNCASCIYMELNNDGTTTIAVLDCDPAEGSPVDG